MAQEVIRQIQDGDSSVEIRTSDMILLEEETRVRLQGIFSLSKPCSNGDAVWSILEAFGLLDAVVRKKWAKWAKIDERRDLKIMIPTLQKRDLGSCNGQLITIDFTIGTQI